MLIEYYKPRSLSAKRLDKFLAGGWFRSSNGLFRNKILCLSGQLCTVLNVRIPLEDYSLSKSMRKLRNKNRDFRVDIGPLQICHQMEDLYDLTRFRFKGFIFPDIYSFLFDLFDREIFNSYHVKVYDGDKLIGASIFDLGQNSVMSVLGLHDPDYKKYSMGKYTMLQEVLYAQSSGFKYYYPGYVLKEKDDFDYKLSLGKFQGLSPNGRWVDLSKVHGSSSPADKIRKASEILSDALNRAGIPNKKLLYKLFSLGYAYPSGTFLKQPVIFIVPELRSNPFKITVAAYDHESGDYKLTYPIPIQDKYLAENQSDEFKDGDVYYDMILQDNEEEEFHFSQPAALIKFIEKGLEEQARHPNRQLFTPKG